MNKDFGPKILELRKIGLSYNLIAKQLNCSKAVVSYHCKKYQLEDIGLGAKLLNHKKILAMIDFYQSNSLVETAKKFQVSKTTVKKYAKRPAKLIKSDIENRKINYQRIKTRRQILKIKAIGYKGGECNKCGYNKCSWALDFHHTNPGSKDFNIAAYSTLSWERIKLELDKCILVCSNCHREIHHSHYLSKLN